VTDNHFVDVWIIPIPVELPERPSLSEAEWARAERMFPVPQKTFIASHYALRRILARYLEIAPDQIEFEVDAYRKPSLRGATSLSFNLSHSEELALVAVTRGRQIGVDVEFVRPIDEMEALVERFFTREENWEFSRLDAQARTEAFLRLWTRKEALLKAMGPGLHTPLNRFRVPLEAAAIDERLTIIEDDTGAALDWSLFAFEPAPQYVGAVVVEGQVDVPPVLRHYPEDL